MISDSHGLNSQSFVSVIAFPEGELSAKPSEGEHESNQQAVTYCVAVLVEFFFQAFDTVLSWPSCVDIFEKPKQAR